MTEPEDIATPPEATFETLEGALEKVTRQLEDASIPLEERLALHARAASMHRQLEAILEEARKATGGAEPEAASGDPSAAAPDAEPYEAVRDRLAAIVDALEADDLPLGRVVALHREAQLLAARCEAILDAAQERIERTASAAADPDGSAPEPARDAAPTGDDDPDADAPC
jgi:exodeoxyribonuclease VII small subunit